MNGIHRVAYVHARLTYKILPVIDKRFTHLVLRGLLADNALPPGGKIVQRRSAMFQPRGDVSLDVGRTQMDHDIDRWHRRQSFDDGKVEVTCVEWVQQCKVETSRIQLRHDPIDGLVCFAGGSLDRSPKFLKPRFTGGKELSAGIGHEEIRERASLLLSDSPGRQRTSVRKRSGVLNYYPASPREKVDIRPLGGEFLAGRPGRIDVPFYDLMLLFRYPTANYHRWQSVVGVCHNFSFTRHSFSRPYFFAAALFPFWMGSSSVVT